MGTSNPAQMRAIAAARATDALLREIAESTTQPLGDSFAVANISGDLVRELLPEKEGS